MISYSFRNRLTLTHWPSYKCLKSPMIVWHIHGKKYYCSENIEIARKAMCAGLHFPQIGGPDIQEGINLLY